MVTNCSTSRTLELMGATLSARAVVGASGAAVANGEQPDERVQTAEDGAGRPNEPAADVGSAAGGGPAAGAEEPGDAGEPVGGGGFFFWRSAARDGPAEPWRSLFR